MTGMLQIAALAINGIVGNELLQKSVQSLPDGTKTKGLENGSCIAIFRYIVLNISINTLGKSEMNAVDATVEMDVDAIHKALANPTRRQILAWLKEPSAHFSM